MKERKRVERIQIEMKYQQADRQAIKFFQVVNQTKPYGQSKLLDDLTYLATTYEYIFYTLVVNGIRNVKRSYAIARALQQVMIVKNSSECPIAL